MSDEKHDDIIPQPDEETPKKPSKRAVMPLRILAVHGINTEVDYNVEEIWEDELIENGVNCIVDEVRWGSTGMVSGDVAAFTRPKFRADANYKVERALRAFFEDGPGVVLAHSMGTVLALHANRKVQSDMPFICLASPLSNRALIGALKAVGYGQVPYGRPYHFWNDDDPICGGSAAKNPNYFDAVRIAVPDPEVRKMNANSEHDVRLYLSHPHVLSALERAHKSILVPKG